MYINLTLIIFYAFESDHTIVVIMERNILLFIIQQTILMCVWLIAIDIKWQAAIFVNSFYIFNHYSQKWYSQNHTICIVNMSILNIPLLQNYTIP